MIAFMTSAWSHRNNSQDLWSGSGTGWNALKDTAFTRVGLLVYPPVPQAELWIHLVCSRPTTLGCFSLSQRTYKELRQCLTGCLFLMPCAPMEGDLFPASKTPPFSPSAPLLSLAALRRSLSLDCHWFFKFCVPCLLTDWSACLK